jgi:hypothetical protein
MSEHQKAASAAGGVGGASKAMSARAKSMVHQ